MASEIIDVLILIALTEEARIFHQDGFYKLDERDDLESFPYHSFSYADDGGHDRTGLLVVAGEIGSRIRDAALVFAKEFSPKFVLNVGISGMIKDPKVGDVVVPTHLNVIDYRAAAQDDGHGGYTFLAGGKPALVSSIATGIFNSVSFQKDNKMASLQAFAKAKGVRLTDEETRKLKTWQTRGKLAEVPAIVPGPFAISNMLMKSDTFKELVLKRSDRNYVAADMESGLIADGLLSLKAPPPFYAIRAISDPANTEKPEYDAVGNGLIRQWAMANARQTVKLLLRQPKLFGAEQASLANANVVLSADYSSDYPGQRIIGAVEAADFDDRFANLEASPSASRDETGAGRMRFSDFAARVCQKPRGGRFLVQGRGGGGKSAVLKATELYVKRLAEPPETVFLNVRKVCTDAKDSSLDAVLRQRISRDAPGAIGSCNSVVVFLDELYGHSDEPPVLDLLENLLSKNEPTFIVAFGRDHFELISAASDSTKDPYIFDTTFDLMVDLKAISVRDDALASKVISGIINTGGVEPKPAAEGVLESLRRLGFPYLSHFAISIYLDNLGKVAFDRQEDSTHFVLRSMVNLYADLYGRGNEPPFNLMCVEALRSYCPSLVKSRPRPERRKSRIGERYQESFAHFPRIVQTALIAQAVVYILTEFNKNKSAVFRSHGIEEKAFLSLVFSNDVNKCVKDLLSDARVEDAVLTAAKTILNKLEPQGLSYALYLFGRAKSGKGKREAQAAFDDAAPHLEAASMPSDSQARKFWQLARRSLHISRSMNQDREATDAYISNVLNNPEEDGLNRSFHLEYYRDHQGTGMTVQLELEDKGGPWPRTRHILRQRIADALRRSARDEYDRICILTYFSLVRFRHERGTLSEAERSSELDLLKSVIESDINPGERLGPFLVMVQNALSKPKYTSIDAILELYALKSLPRAGWVERKFVEKGDVIETVGSHVFGTMLLAELLCDCVVPPVSEVERSRVLQLLVYHDLAEAYIGDYIPSDGTTKNLEGAAIERISTLATYEYLPRLAEITKSWKQFEIPSERAGILAKDFDKLDAVFQAFAYADRFPTPDNRRRFLADCRDQIVTPSLREIAEEVFVRATQLPA